MFLVEDLLKAFLDYLSNRRQATAGQHDQALVDSRKAMRRLASCLSEVVGMLEVGLHKLNQQRHDRSAFADTLSDLVNHDRLVKACSASGVCEDLRSAQDALQNAQRNFPLSQETRLVDDLVRQMDGYEREFIRAILEFMSKARECDLVAAAQTSDFDPTQVINALDERITALRAIIRKIEAFLDSMRVRELGMRA